MGSIPRKNCREWRCFRVSLYVVSVVWLTVLPFSAIHGISLDNPAPKQILDTYDRTYVGSIRVCQPEGELHPNTGATLHESPPLVMHPHLPPFSSHSTNRIIFFLPKALAHVQTRLKTHRKVFGFEATIYRHCLACQSHPRVFLQGPETK
jgi:hypothetical protein